MPVYDPLKQALIELSNRVKEEHVLDRIRRQQDEALNSEG